ncbi:MAG: magnesium transporter [Alphaproteobacteria bacterium GM202ARS2]|nr:magnesium transporter [Alphaproteobacteria bacterium GM202ARS2]
MPKTSKVSKRVAQPSKPSKTHVRAKSRPRRRGGVPSRPLEARSTLARVDVPVQTLHAVLNEGDTKALTSFIDGLESTQRARCVDLLDGDKRQVFLAALQTYAQDKKAPSLIAEVLSLLTPSVQAHVVESLGVAGTARIVGHLETDDILAILEGLEADVRQAILAKLPKGAQEWLKESLKYPQQSAGRLMQREVVAVPITWRVGDVIEHLREDRDLPDDFFDVQVVDPRQHPLGMVPLGRLLRAKPQTQVQDIMETHMTPIPVHADQEEVAFLFRDKDLTSNPVVDEDGRLVGVVTIDDVVDVIDAEAGEDLMRLAGVTQESFHSTWAASVRNRFIWLAFNLVFTFVSAYVISRFTDAIDKVIALAVLMPVVASMGGIAAVQTLTVTVRALAMKELVYGNRWRSIVKEFILNSSNGLLLGALAGLVAWWWYQDVGLGVIIVAAVVANIVMAGLLGTLVPLLMEKLGIDPAVASGPVVTVGTDIFGFLIFLTLGAVYLVG